MNATADHVTVVHGGGDALAFGELDVVADATDARQRFALDGANATGDGDDRFEPTERFARDHRACGGEMEVLVIHVPPNTMLTHEYLSVGPGGAATAASFNYEPGDFEPGDTLAFDAGGSGGTGGIGIYEWDWDGTFEKTSDAITPSPGTTSYGVTGLSTDSRRFRLTLGVATADPTTTLTVDRLEIDG